jgi:hypothetical protein
MKKQTGRMTVKPDPIVQAIRAELNANKWQWRRLARLLKKSKHQLSYRWLVAFASGQIADPSFTRLKHLGSFLGVKIITAGGRHFNKFTPE